MSLDPILRAELLGHVAENLSVRRASGTGDNLILGIEGRPGTGKTFHCKVVFGTAGVEIVRFGMSEFESEAAGVPATRLLERYLAASELISKGIFAVLIIEDLDLALGPQRHADANDEIVQYTMNRDLLTGTLMGLCDSPSKVHVPPDAAVEDAGRVRFCERVPIVITGNHLDFVYTALLRHGRCRLLRWEPSQAARLAALMHIFPELTHDQARSLLEQFADETAAFWSSVRTEVAASRRRDFIVGELKIDPHLQMGDLVRRFEDTQTRQIFFEDIHQAALGLVRAPAHGVDDVRKW